MSRLDDIKTDSANVLIQYTNGYVYSRLKGTGEEQDLFNDLMRLHYLYAIVDGAYESGVDTYIGDTITEDIEEVYTKIHHYNGLFIDTDLSEFDEIVPDDGDGGSCSGSSGDTQSDDHYRAGNLAVVAGANAVTFIKDGVPSPLASSDYTINAYVMNTSGQRQDNLVITTQTAGGFVASDVLKAGTLYYQATLNT